MTKMRASKSLLLFIGAGVIASCFAADGGEWNYDRADKQYGPDAWAQNYHECGGDRNSPINIEKDKTVRMKAQAWDLNGWNSKANWTVTDRNNTMHFNLENANISTTGGDLDNVYNVLQFHFHWGQTNAKGSEHTVDGKSYPLVVHFVHWDSSYTTVYDAVGGGLDDGLAALGFFFEIQKEDNPNLEKIVNAVRMTREDASQIIEDYELDALANFVSPAIDGNFFRYFGGLTTPGCQQIVKWTVFETPIGISQAQMDVFRDQGTHIQKEEYYRDPVPVGSRVVTLYDANYDPTLETTTKTLDFSPKTSPKFYDANGVASLNKEFHILALLSVIFFSLM